MSKIHNPNVPRQPQTPSEWGDTASRVVQQTPQRALRPDGTDHERLPEELPPEGLLPNGDKKLSAADAERLVSQAGYERRQKKKGKFHVGDSSQAPIPLPVEDVDESEWEQGALDKSQEDLTLESAAMASTGEEMDPGEMSLSSIAKLLQHTFQPTEESVKRLQNLADGKTAEPLDMAAVAGHAQSLFQKELTGVPQGPLLLAASLLVAGLGEAVQNTPEGKGLEGQNLMRGMQAVVDKGNEAVADARSMNEGISQKLAIQRTFVFKR
jgi:hypothetical protein